jgi:hypothetical protein
MRLTVALWIATIAVVTAGGSQEIPRAALSGVIAALLADGRISLMDVATGQQLAEYVAAPHPRDALTDGRLARAASGDEVFAVLPDHDGRVVVGLNVRTLRGRTVGRLPADTYRGLAVGSRTGRIFAFRSVGPTVEALDANTGEHHTLFTFQTGRDVSSGAVSVDERRIYVAYHGRGTGIDWFDLKDQGWQHGAYVASHGDFAVIGNLLLAATGGPAILEVNDTGKVVRSLNTALADVHLMEFAVDPDRRIIYAAGDCMHVGGGGLTATPWPQAGELPARVLAPLRAFTVCGSRISLGPAGTWVAVVRTVEADVPRASRAGTVLVVDTGTGMVLQRLGTSSDVLDVLAIR